jgi:bacterioferritin (cytochrome b1)
MIEPTELGPNRTGMQRSPLQDEMLSATKGERAGAAPPNPQIAALRQSYIEDSEALGTVPPAPTLKGKIGTLVDKAAGRRMQVLVDKLSERLAFERGGARLYEAILAKATALADPAVDVTRLEEIRTQEVEHANLLAVALMTLGADPTAQTPCADLVGVQSLGLLQSVSDPRTTLLQCLNSALAAELIDNAAWDLLATLARASGQEDLATQCETALAQEMEHLATVREWHEAMVLKDGGVSH